MRNLKTFFCSKNFRLSILIASFALLLNSCFDNCNNGNGKLIVQERNISQFSTLRLKGSANVYLTEGNELSLTVETDENLINSIYTINIGNEFIIDNENDICPSEVRVNVTAPEFSSVVLDGSGNIYINTLDSGSNININTQCNLLLSGSGNISSSAAFTCTSIAVTLDGSGNITLTSLVANNSDVNLDGSGNITISYIESGELEANLSGSGNINLQDVSSTSAKLTLPGSGNINIEGFAVRSQCLLGGSGNIKAGSFEADTVSAVLSGSGDITVNAKDELSAEISGSGNIYYYGNPFLKSVIITGSGEIIKR